MVSSSLCQKTGPIKVVTKLKKEVPRIFLSHTLREKAFLYKAILKKTETDYI